MAKTDQICFDHKFWLRTRDSNPNKQSQSLSCYRYTIPQCNNTIIYFFFVLSRVCFVFIFQQESISHFST